VRSATKPASRAARNAAHGKGNWANENDIGLSGNRTGVRHPGKHCRARRDLRLAHDLDGAEQRANKVLAGNAGDFRATYTLGLILIDRSGIERPGKADRAAAARGLGQLLKAAALLKTADPDCAAKNNWYGIYNTLGAEYFNIGDKQDAQVYLQLAYGKKDALQPKTRAKMLDNLGQIAFEAHDYDRAARYFNEASAAGSPYAARNAAAAANLKVLFAGVRKSGRASSPMPFAAMASPPGAR
jgi:hypothetical protein